MNKIIQAIALILTTFTLNGVTEITNEATTPILTPSLAKQQITKLKLDNGLEAIIISDPDTDKSGAVLSVRVGSWDDPIQHPGIAHFLEHMLFMGTKKYPQEGEYHRFIQDNSGQANAFTANYVTSYMFSINNNAFDQGLDRFSQFFKEPLFNPSGVSRELHAIDQEYEMNVQKNEMREYFVYKALSDPTHPQSRFNIGNTQTLKDVTQNELIQWYQEHYSANLMRLLVISPEPIEKLKELVIQDFSDIKNNHREAFTTKQPHTPKDLEGSMIVIEPLKDTRTITIGWELPTKFVLMNEIQPETIFCFIMGHEGEESLLAELIKEGLADGLACGNYNSGAINRDLFIKITLTDKGLHEVNTVIQRVFQAINNFKSKGLPKSLFDEIQKTQLLSYQYPTRDNVFNSLMKHGINLYNENISTYPEYTQITQKYDPEAMQAFLNFLSPENALFFLTAPKGTTNYVPDREEPWMKVDYSIHKIDPKVLESWNQAPLHPNINLPTHNPFLPDSLELIPSDANDSIKQNGILPIPSLVVDNPGMRIYYCKDSKFSEPKISWYIEIKTPEVIAGDPLANVMADLYVRTLSENLKKYSYPADLAGLSYEIKQESNAISIKIQGFNDKAQRLLEDILDTMKQIEINSYQFTQHKEILSRKYQNFSKEPPLTQSTELFKKAVYLKYSTNLEKAAAIKKLNLKKFQNYVDSLFNKTYVQGLFYGNMSKEQTMTLSDLLKAKFNKNTYLVSEQIKKEVINLPNDQGPFYLEGTTSMQGNAALLAIEYTPFSAKGRAVQQILMQALQEPFFSELRTKQQTGYIVSSFGQDIERHIFNIFAVQSVTHDPRDLLARFELFIETFLQSMYRETLTKERFEQIRISTINTLEFSANSFEDTANLLQALAFEFNGNFSWMDQRVSSLKNLEYKDFLSMAQDMLGKVNRRRIACLIRGAQIEDKALIYKKISNLKELKKESTFS